jgi:hypothetical protein
MAVISCEQIFEGRNGGESSGRVLKHTRVYEVITDDDNDDENTVGLASGLPLMGEPLDTSPSATLTDIEPSQSSDSPRIWYVTCNYNSDLPNDQAAEVAGPDETGASVAQANPTEREENPTNRPPVYRIESEKSKEVVEYDWNGTAITNSAGDPFFPPLEAEVSYPVIVIERNYPIGSPILDLGTQALYYDAVNSVAWRGIAPKLLKIEKIGVSYDFENGVAFGRVTFNIKLNWKNWHSKPADMGFNWIQGGKQVRIDIPEGTGQWATEPQLLDGNGQRLNGNDGQIGVLPPVFLDFQIYREIDYAALGI